MQENPTPPNRLSLPFLLLILAQAAHSVEETMFRLYDLVAPARYIGSLTGLPQPWSFALPNALLVLFGLWCWFAKVRPGRGGARALAWFWALLEIANALGHTAFALGTGGYFPGIATAPLLLGFGAWLVVRLVNPPRDGEELPSSNA